MVIDVQTKASKEAYELGQGVFKFLSDVQKALADGWQPGQDVPLILSAALADLVPAMQGVEKLGAEKDENLKAFLTAWNLAGLDIGFLFLNK